MPQPPALELLAKANQLRGLGLWKEAIAAYQRLEAAIPNGAEIQHNLAICWLGLDSAEKALNYANRAIHLKPDLWQSHLIKAKAERKLDASGAATAQTLKALLSKHSAEKISRPTQGLIWLSLS